MAGCPSCRQASQARNGRRFIEALARERSPVYVPRAYEIGLAPKGRRVMSSSDRVRQIMSWYASENPGVQTNIYRMLNTGRLAGTGKMVVLPVDQGVEHGPARSISVNPEAYDPRYHFQLAIDSGNT